MAQIRLAAVADEAWHQQEHRPTHPDPLVAAIADLGDLLREVIVELRRNEATTARLAAALAPSLVPPQPRPTCTATLTPREVDVLERMAAGDTNARIARRLSVTEGTVKTHVQHILRKLDAANRAEAVSRWTQR